MVLNPRCEIWQYFENNVKEGVAVCKLCRQRLKNDRSYSLRKHFNNLHNPKSEIWKYFDNIVDEFVAVCKLCKKRVRNNRHFNLKIHLRQHDIILNEPTTTAPSLRRHHDSLHKSTSGIKEYLCIEMEEKTMVTAAMGLLIHENVKPEIFDSKNMQILLSPICEALSKREKIKFNIDRIQSENVISSLACYIKDEYGNDLHWSLLSLKLDMDLNDMTRSYCVSAQFINDKEVESRALGVVTLKQDQQLFKQNILEILNGFNIDPQQIVAICWDDTKPKINHVPRNSDYLKEIQEFEKSLDIHVNDIKIERYIGVIAQLCIMDVVKTPGIYELFMECRNLVQDIQENLEKFSKQFEENKLKVPQLDSPWKWGSTYEMLNDLKEVSLLNITDKLKEFMEAFCQALSYLQTSLLRFYQEELIYGDFYAEWLTSKLLTEKLFKTVQNQESYLHIILTELLKSVENRSNELLNQDHFKACLYLDPRFQHTLNLPEKMFAVEYLNQLWSRCKMFNHDLVDPVTDLIKQEFSNSSITKEKEDLGDRLLDEYLRQYIQESEVTGLYKKLENLKLPFQKATCNILQFWQDYKINESEIYNLVTVCFAIPATQVSFWEIYLRYIKL